MPLGQQQVNSYSATVASHIRALLHIQAGPLPIPLPINVARKAEDGSGTRMWPLTWKTRMEFLIPGIDLT